MVMVSARGCLHPDASDAHFEDAALIPRQVWRLTSSKLPDVAGPFTIRAAWPCSRRPATSYLYDGGPRGDGVVPGDLGIHDEVTGFGNAFGKGPSRRFGPLGLAFADRTLWLSGTAARTARNRSHLRGRIPTALRQGSQSRRRDFYSTPSRQETIHWVGRVGLFGVAIHGSPAFIASNGSQQAWTLGGPLDMKKASPPLKLIPFIQSKELTDTDALMGATMSPPVRQALLLQSIRGAQ